MARRRVDHLGVPAAPYATEPASGLLPANYPVPGQ